jgi:hypothetical protein
LDRFELERPVRQAQDGNESLTGPTDSPEKPFLKRLARPSPVTPVVSQRSKKRRMLKPHTPWRSGLREMAKTAGLHELESMLTSPWEKMMRKVKAPPTPPWDDKELMSPFISSTRDE